MTRHLHRKHHGHQLECREAAPVPSAQGVRLGATVEAPLSHVKSFFVRRAGYSADGSEPIVGKDDGDSSSGGSGSKSGGQGHNISLPVALGVVYVLYHRLDRACAN